MGVCSWGLMGREETFDHRTIKTKVIFILTQFVYTMVTCLPVFLIYPYFSFHTAYGLMVSGDVDTR
jgi:hypothetical protein